MSQNVRNALIVLALAGAVYAIPGGGNSANFIGSLLSTLIVGAFAFIGYKLYRENRVSIFSLGDRYRGMLYGGVAAIVLMMAVRETMWNTPGGSLLWAAVVGGAAYALVMVFRHYRSFSY
ncbi:MAG: hypothetical protein H0V81_12435 [Solirubrobacterales bacterium]|nr:hypothetical protein [Solirubrobacterales bacterium]